ncbi:MAG: F0F1 ATP synthase subunit delta [Lentisphaerae bacterium]|nr:F0F1 ATP synthase subunit delta [Lentisphaerota bacterium]
MQDVLRVILPIVVANAVVLAVILFIVKKILLSDTMRAVERIRQVEAEVRRKEEDVRREVEEHEKEFSKKKAEAEEDLQKRRLESEAEVAAMRERTLSDARKESDKIIEQAKKNEERQRQQVLQEMEEKAVDYGSQIFKLVFSEEMNAAINTHFIDELLGALEEIDASSITVDCNDTAFISSHPINPKQKKRIETLLAEKFKTQIKVQETVKEDLLGGLILKLGSLEIDGSLLNRFNEAVSEVKKSVQI